MSQNPSTFDSDCSATRPSLQRSQTVAVLGIAFALRLLVVWSVIARFPPRWFFMRGMEMGLLAKSLLAGQGLSSPFGSDTGPSAFVAPVYPILVAIVFKVFGAFSLASEIVILTAQVALNMVTIWLVMRVARQLFNQTTATIAGLIWACSLPLIWIPTIFWETSLSCCLLIGLIAVALRYKRLSQIDPVQWLKLGSYCGLAALVNPALLPSLLAIVSWTAWTTRRQSGTKPLLAALTFLLVFSPWPLRNARTFHAFIPLRTTVGFELWMGNHAGATGFLDESLFPTFNATELADYKARGEMGYTAHKCELARKYIDSNPLDFVKLTATRAIRFWAGSGTEHGSVFFVIHAIFTTVLGVIGLIQLFRSRRLEFFVLFVSHLLLFPLPYLITHAEFRYRLVIDPLLTVFAARTIAEFYRWIARERQFALTKSGALSGIALDAPLVREAQVTWRRS